MFRLKPVEMFAYFFNGLKPGSIEIPYFCGSKFKIYGLSLLFRKNL